MGFDDAWIKLIATMYISTSSTVLEVGATSKLFSISRFVRQGVPMAPFLFFFFGLFLSRFCMNEASPFYDDEKKYRFFRSILSLVTVHARNFCLNMIFVQMYVKISL